MNFDKYLGNTKKQLTSLCIFMLYISFCIIILNKTFSFTHVNIKLLNHFATNICYVACLTKLLLLLKQKKFLYLFFLFSILLLSVIVMKESKSKDIFYIIILSIAFSFLNFKIAIYSYIFVVGLILSAIITYFILEFSTDSSFIFRDGDIRNTFGFIHPNGLGGITCFLVLSIWAISNSFKLKCLSFLILCLTLCFLCYVVDCRTAQFILFITIISFLFYELLVKYGYVDIFFNCKIVKLLFINFFTILTIATFIIAICYDKNNSVHLFFDRLFSGRLELSNNGLSEFRLTPFGYPIQFMDLDPFGLASVSAVSYQYLDSLYLNVTYNFGVVSVMLLCILHSILVYKCIKIKNYQLVLVLTLFSVYGLMENFYIRICFNVFLYLCFSKMLSLKQISK